MTNEQPVVLLEHAQKSFGGTPVLKDISLKVQPGEVVAVIGPSGGGKSTLLRCMTLLETLDAGRLAYGDLVVAESDGAGAAAYAPKAVLKEAKTRFGLVFQNFNLFPHYSVLKNITDAPLHVQKRPKDEVLAAARGLLNLKGHRVAGGMRASLYNAMPMAGVDALVDYLKQFEVEHHV